MPKYKVQRKSDRKIIKMNMTHEDAVNLANKLEKQNSNDDFWVVVQ